MNFSNRSFICLFALYFFLLAGVGASDTSYDRLNSQVGKSKSGVSKKRGFLDILKPRACVCKFISYVLDDAVLM
jgi:hypothetical protein